MQAFASNLHCFRLHHRYIEWVQTSYASGQKDRLLLSILERATNELVHISKYHNDVRYLELWIQRSDLLRDPEEIFDYLYKHRIAERLSLFYIAWAWLLEHKGNYAKAQFVYELGRNRSAQPLDRLLSRQKQFERRLFRQWTILQGIPTAQAPHDLHTNFSSIVNISALQSSSASSDKSLHQASSQNAAGNSSNHVSRVPSSSNAFGDADLFQEPVARKPLGRISREVTVYRENRDHMIGSEDNYVHSDADVIASYESVHHSTAQAYPSQSSRSHPQSQLFGAASSSGANRYLGVAESSVSVAASSQNIHPTHSAAYANAPQRSSVQPSEFDPCEDIATSALFELNYPNAKRRKNTAAVYASLQGPDSFLCADPPQSLPLSQNQNAPIAVFVDDDYRSPPRNTSPPNQRVSRSTNTSRIDPNPIAIPPISTKLREENGPKVANESFASVNSMDSARYAQENVPVSIHGKVRQESLARESAHSMKDNAPFAVLSSHQKSTYGKEIPSSRYEASLTQTTVSQRSIIPPLPSHTHTSKENTMQPTKWTLGGMQLHTPAEHATAAAAPPPFQPSRYSVLDTSNKSFRLVSGAASLLHPPRATEFRDVTGGMAQASAAASSIFVDDEFIPTKPTSKEATVNARPLPIQARSDRAVTAQEQALLQSLQAAQRQVQQPLQAPSKSKPQPNEQLPLQSSQPQSRPRPAPHAAASQPLETKAPRPGPRLFRCPKMDVPPPLEGEKFSVEEIRGRFYRAGGKGRKTAGAILPGFPGFHASAPTTASVVHANVPKAIPKDQAKKDGNPGYTPFIAHSVGNTAPIPKADSTQSEPTDHRNEGLATKEMPVDPNPRLLSSTPVPILATTPAAAAASPPVVPRNNPTTATTTTTATVNVPITNTIPITTSPTTSSVTATVAHNYHGETSPQAPFSPGIVSKRPKKQLMRRFTFSAIRPKDSWKPMPILPVAPPTTIQQQSLRLTSNDPASTVTPDTTTLNATSMQSAARIFTVVDSISSPMMFPLAPHADAHADPTAHTRDVLLLQQLLRECPAESVANGGGSGRGRGDGGERGGVDERKESSNADALRLENGADDATGLFPRMQMHIFEDTAMDVPRRSQPEVEASANTHQAGYFQPVTVNPPQLSTQQALRPSTASNNGGGIFVYQDAENVPPAASTLRNSIHSNAQQQPQRNVPMETPKPVTKALYTGGERATFAWLDRSPPSPITPVTRASPTIHTLLAMQEIDALFAKSMNGSEDTVATDAPFSDGESIIAGPMAVASEAAGQPLSWKIYSGRENTFHAPIIVDLQGHSEENHVKAVFTENQSRRVPQMHVEHNAHAIPMYMDQENQVKIPIFDENAPPMPESGEQHAQMELQMLNRASRRPLSAISLKPIE